MGILTKGYFESLEGGKQDKYRVRLPHPCDYDPNIEDVCDQNYTNESIGKFSTDVDTAGGFPDCCIGTDKHLSWYFVPQTPIPTSVPFKGHVNCPPCMEGCFAPEGAVKGKWNPAIKDDLWGDLIGYIDGCLDCSGAFLGSPGLMPCLYCMLKAYDRGEITGVLVTVHCPEGDKEYLCEPYLNSFRYIDEDGYINFQFCYGGGNSIQIDVLFDHLPSGHGNYYGEDSDKCKLSGSCNDFFGSCAGGNITGIDWEVIEI